MTTGRQTGHQTGRYGWQTEAQHLRADGNDFDVAAIAALGLEGTSSDVAAGRLEALADAVDAALAADASEDAEASR